MACTAALAAGAGSTLTDEQIAEINRINEDATIAAVHVVDLEPSLRGRAMKML